MRSIQQSSRRNLIHCSSKIKITFILTLNNNYFVWNQKILGGLEMVQYRVIYKTSGLFGCEMPDVKILTADEAISRKEIARNLGIAIDSIVEIAIL